jgi:uncharacterized protein YfaS (alpha-2-macroglobulin family)
MCLTGPGSCTIDANQSGNASYNAAPQIQQAFTVAKGAQTITFTSTAPSNAQHGGATYTVVASDSSGIQVALKIDTSSSSVCSLSGTTVNFTAPGTCTIDANQSGNSDYSAAAQAQQSFPVS